MIWGVVIERAVCYSEGQIDNGICVMGLLRSEISKAGWSGDWEGGWVGSKLMQLRGILACLLGQTWFGMCCALCYDIVRGSRAP